MHSTVMAPAVVISPDPSFAPYAGPWSHAQAGHLLRRASFAPLQSEINESINLGLEASLDRLLSDSIAPPPPPVYAEEPTNPAANLGDVWVDLPLDGRDNQAKADDNNMRTRSLLAWVYLTAADTPFNIREKMVLFWHNHFGVGGIGINRGVYRMWNKYRRSATGNFRELVKAMTVDPVMLNFLNGNRSTAANPNENYAREILELYTVGKGPQVAPGDYTHFTETDVTELARAFTGWRTRYANSTTPGETYESYFQENRHDDTEKTLSHRFNNAVITANGAEEYKDVVDLIFQQDEVARHICRKLYRYFVYYDISPAVESNIIEPMARVLIDNDYEVRPALRALLTSEHFYEDQVIGDMIKSPMEFMLSIQRPAGHYRQTSLERTYLAARFATNQARNQGMDYRTPPSVAGWTAYYQEPTFNRLWLNTATLQQRVNVQLRTTQRPFYLGGERFDTDWLAFIENFETPQFVDQLIEQIALNFLPKPLAAEQHAGLKDILLNGQPDFVWTDEYVAYQANPTDQMLRDSVATRLNEMMYGLFQLAEFHLQ